MLDVNWTKIRELAKQRGYKLNRLAELAGMDYRRFKNAVARGSRAHLCDVLPVARALGVSVPDLLADGQKLTRQDFYQSIRLQCGRLDQEGLVKLERYAAQLVKDHRLDGKGVAKKPEREPGLAGWLDERGLGFDQAVKTVPVGREIMEHLYAGGHTLPSFALDIGRALGMTEAEVRPLGRHLAKPLDDTPAWIRAHAVELDPEWWRLLPAWKPARTRKTAGASTPEAPEAPEKKKRMKDLTEEEYVRRYDERIARELQRKRERYYASRGGTVLRTCKQCGRQYDMAGGYRGAHYCSQECAYAAKVEREKAYRADVKSGTRRITHRDDRTEVGA